MNNLLGRFTLFVGVLILGWIAYQVVGYAKLRFQLSAKIADLRSKGQPVSIVDLRRDDLAKSAAYEQLVKLLPRIESFQQSMIPFGLAKELSPEDRSEKDDTIEAYLEQNSTLIVDLREASQLPIGNGWYDFSADSSMFLDSAIEHLSAYRSAVRTLAADAEFQLSNENADEAARDVIAMLRWSDHVASEPSLICYLTSLACRRQSMSVAAAVVTSESLTDDVRQELLRSVSGHDPIAAWSAALTSERAISVALSNDLGPVSQLPSMLTDRIQYLDLIEEYRFFAEEPWGLRDPNAASTSGLLTGQVNMALSSGFEGFRSGQAVTRALLVLDAWHRASRPGKVEVSALDVGASHQIDPFDGSPMRVLANEEKVTVYSVGPNMNDDGGSLTEDLDVGVSVGRTD